MSMDDGTVGWEGRRWLKSCGGQKQKIKTNTGSSIRFCSYHVLAQSGIQYLRHIAPQSWEQRRVTLSLEIESYNADVICLQDADHFHDYWKSNLSQLGYDTVFKQRSEIKGRHEEGVIIGFKRNLFQLFKTVPIELNDSIHDLEEDETDMRAKIITDDVGLLLFLQPWEVITEGKIISNGMNSAFCVACTALCDKIGASDLRLIQAKHFTRILEEANRSFQVPVLLGVSLFDDPSSPAYHFFSTGRTPIIDSTVPNRCSMPTLDPTCRGSVRLEWTPPVRNQGSRVLAVDSYVIAWRPGGSSALSFHSEKEVQASTCKRYETSVDKKGHMKKVLKLELTAVISGLASGVPYEFRIAAVNELGRGAWSNVTMPVLTLAPVKCPKMPPLIHLKNLGQVLELRELSAMAGCDGNMGSTLLPPEDPQDLAPATLLTPRDLEGRPVVGVPKSRILGLDVNPREGWKQSINDKNVKIKQKLDVELAQGGVLRRSLIRTSEGFKAVVSDSLSGRVARIDLGGGNGMGGVGGGGYGGNGRVMSGGRGRRGRGGGNGGIGVQGVDEQDEGDDDSDGYDGDEYEREDEGEGDGERDGAGEDVTDGQTDGHVDYLRPSRWGGNGEGDDRSVDPTHPNITPGNMSSNMSTLNAPSFRPDDSLRESMESSSMSLQQFPSLYSEFSQPAPFYLPNREDNVDYIDVLNTDSVSPFTPHIPHGQHTPHTPHTEILKKDVEHAESIVKGLPTATELAEIGSVSLDLDDPYSSDSFRDDVDFDEDSGDERDRVAGIALIEQRRINVERLCLERRRGQVSADAADSSSVLLDCRGVLLHIGSEDARQVHNIGLRSAYDWVAAAGEPCYTISCPNPDLGPGSQIKEKTADKKKINEKDIQGGDRGVGCRDFIFYSKAGLQVRRVLISPPLSQIMSANEADPTQALCVPDLYWCTYDRSGECRSTGNLPLPPKRSNLAKLLPTLDRYGDRGRDSVRGSDGGYRGQGGGYGGGGVRDDRGGMGGSGEGGGGGNGEGEDDGSLGDGGNDRGSMDERDGARGGSGGGFGGSFDSDSEEDSSDLSIALSVAALKAKLINILNASRAFTGTRAVEPDAKGPLSGGKVSAGGRGTAKKEKEEFWIGASWVPSATLNPGRSHNGWLPTETFCSTHIALCADFNIVTENLGSKWK